MRGTRCWPYACRAGYQFSCSLGKRPSIDGRNGVRTSEEGEELVEPSTSRWPRHTAPPFVRPPLSTLTDDRPERSHWEPLKSRKVPRFRVPFGTMRRPVRFPSSALGGGFVPAPFW